MAGDTFCFIMFITKCCSHVGLERGKNKQRYMYIMLFTKECNLRTQKIWNKETLF